MALVPDSPFDMPPELSLSAWHFQSISDAPQAPADDITAAADVESADDGPEATAREVTSEYAVADIIADGSFLDIQLLESMIEALKSKKNIVLQGPPGAGKTWLARRLGWVLCNERQSDRITLLQFHPSMSYEDFIRGFRPGSDGKLTLIDGPLLTASQNARQDSEHDYVVVIEEINRGTPAQIFGEMLTLLEHDKRDPENALNVAYPGAGKDRFNCPRTCTSSAR
ncbi:AAA domain-containing protein [Rhodococcus sp. IEGM 248]|uniref:McrB family protein n=1 Tax=Rhodococcus opacus TaxID=37919 RepID=UPI0013BEC511|nr:AAA family ATPase [Rhodococcus opacus]NDV10835.1 AAA domain-containing protein [Rhodococcus sp. IEGM 248]